ncbi:stimulus-sensing domain-containing protein, partial [Phenylobacterium sp.]|uniref:stimulus-sensing domain-containing protein n=1 Tax=Phenylobacterium sp. TaxID=1871053 RepID=UPI002F425D52
MASDTATANPDPDASDQGVEGLGATGTEDRRKRPRRTWLPGSRLGRLIIALNIIGLAVLITGVLVLDARRQGLVNARLDSLTTQGDLIASIIDNVATTGEPPAMDTSGAGQVLQLLANPKAQRARLFDAQGQLVLDSNVVVDRIEQKVLPPARSRDGFDLRVAPNEG